MKPSRIEVDFGVSPAHVSGATISEARRLCGHSWLPDEFLLGVHLDREVERLYGRNGSFTQRLRAAENPQDVVYQEMRPLLAAWLKERDPALAERLPVWYTKKTRKR